MKKFLLPIVATLLFVSCSSDDDNVYVPPVTPPASTNFLKATIDGTEYTFDTFNVETETHTEPDFTYTDLHVTASISNDSSKEIVFSLEQNVVGSTDVIFFFYLLNNEEEFDTDHVGETFVHNVTVNADRRIAGTFSGALARFDESGTVQITNGSFDIKY